MSMTLPPAPTSVVDERGKPRLGAYRGVIAPVRWDAVAGRMTRRLKHKRWHYASIGGPDCLVAVAIIDLGWVASAFTYVFDRTTKTLACDLSYTGLPELNEASAAAAAATLRSAS